MTMWSSWALAGVGLASAVAGVALLASLDLKRFVSRKAALETRDDLEAFRRVVGRQMYAALVMWGVAGAAVVVIVYGRCVGEISDGALRVVLGLGGAFIGIGQWGRAIEARAKEIRTKDAEMERARDEVVRVWMKKALPEW